LPGSARAGGPGDQDDREHGQDARRDAGQEAGDDPNEQEPDHAAVLTFTPPAGTSVIRRRGGSGLVRDAPAW